MKITSKIMMGIFLLLLFVVACKKNPSDTPTGCITTDIATPLTGQSITFTDCASGSISATWDYGDGTSGTGITSIKSYYASGSYTVTLISTNSKGQVSTAKKTVVVKSLPVAYFTTSTCGNTGSEYLVVGDTVLFAASNTGASSFFWDFGDGTTSQDSMPRHVFTQLSSGVAVKLRVTNAAGSDSNTIAFPVATPYQGTFQGAAYGHVALLNSTGLSSGNTFFLDNYPSYSPYHHTSTIGTIVNGKTFVIQPQSVTFIDGTGNNNNITATVHGHGSIAGSCAARLYIVDTMVTSTGTYIYHDTLSTF